MRSDDAYIDQVAQAVIDKLEERQRLSLVVERVAQRVLELQQQRDEAQSILAASSLNDALAINDSDPMTRSTHQENPHVEPEANSVSPR